MATAQNKVATTVVTTSLQNDDIDMREDWVHPALPLRFAFREIDFRIDSKGHLQFGFRNSDRAEPLNGRTIEEIVDTFRSTLAPPDGSPLLNPFVSTTQTPLDLQVGSDPVNGDPIYIIYRFFKPRNITFSPTRKAMSHKNGDAVDRYGLLRHVGAAGPGTAAPAADCELIYFACVPKNVDYQDGFNLRVQLEQEPHLGPPPTPRILDIEIDPDIRFPGGSIT